MHAKKDIAADSSPQPASLRGNQGQPASITGLSRSRAGSAHPLLLFWPCLPRSGLIRGGERVVSWTVEVVYLGAYL